MVEVDVVKILTLPLRIFGALSIASGLILFSSEKFIKMLYLDGIKEKYGIYIGLVFVISVSMFVVFLIGQLLKWVKKKYDLFKLKRNQYNFLKQLDQNHVEFIQMFIRAPANVIPLSLHDGLVLEMIHHQVITPTETSQFVNPLDPRIYFFLQPWVIARIKEHSDLMEIYQGSSVKTTIQD